ncbi:hypothetical protein AA313_de0202471 [Arthrobotrys entomopaga]|nr:hypothetical protein AA313_de0202471 [Arthrobotrys entomopaga]
MKFTSVLVLLFSAVVMAAPSSGPVEDGNDLAKRRGCPNGEICLSGGCYTYQCIGGPQGCYVGDRKLGNC